MEGFGTIKHERVLAEDDLFVIAKDKYPVSPGHTLVIAKRVVAHFAELTTDEKVRLVTWIDWCINCLEHTLDPKPDGFNIGLNDGAAAGQVVAQLHVHVIPRYNGDVVDPRGGIRQVIPEKARYWPPDPVESQEGGHQP